MKTRLTTQSVAAAGAAAVKYSGVLNCFQVVLREEGVGALYRALPPRLLSVTRAHRNLPAHGFPRELHQQKLIFRR